jgi:hypothetical protein
MLVYIVLLQQGRQKLFLIRSEVDKYSRNVGIDLKF